MTRSQGAPRGAFDLFFGRVLRSRPMPRPVALVVTMGVFFVLSGCATRGSVRDVNFRVDKVAKDLAELRQAQDLAMRESAAATVELRTLGQRLRETSTLLRETT